MSINSACNTKLNNFVIKESGGRVNIFKQILLAKKIAILHEGDAHI